MTSETETAGRVTSTRWALAGLSLSMLLSSLGTSIANVGLPTFAEAFDASFQGIQWVVLAYLLAITTLIVSVGRLGDILGRRRLLLAGIALFTAASTLSGLAPTLAVLIAARFAQGLGAAIMMALAMALVGETVAKDKTGSAMGLLGTMSAVGTALGPSLGGLLIAGAGWRAIFLAMVPLGLLAYLIAHHQVPADRPKPETLRAGFDRTGTVLLALTLAAYAVAMTSGRDGFGLPAIILLCAAAIGTGLFLLVEAKTRAPLIRPAMFRDPALSGSLATSAIVATVMMTTLVVGPFYLVRAVGLDNALAGFVMSIGPILSAVSGIPAGRLVDRFGASVIVLLGLAFMMTGSFALAVLPALSGLAGYIAAIAILTPGYQLFQAANNTAVMANVSPDRRGVVSGMLNLSRNLGLMTGAAVMGAIFAATTGAADVSTAPGTAIAGGMRLTFIVASLLLVGALVIAGFTSRPHGVR